MRKQKLSLTKLNIQSFTTMENSRIKTIIGGYDHTNWYSQQANCSEDLSCTEDIGCDRSRDVSCTGTPGTVNPQHGPD